MAKFFENNIEDTEFLLHLILEDDKIRVEKVIGQYAIANLQGHSSRLDIYAVDRYGNHFNVEVQRTNSGAIPKRARYHADMIEILYKICVALDCGIDEIMEFTNHEHA